ncbi:hypothetical protein BDY24DRAFT_437754 [Mrakia frigida]|uniref:uncharacterized protein n=1 Tax=Mrakia frigida TaxID=29902 RepID=UPI003FCBF999
MDDILAQIAQLQEQTRLQASSLQAQASCGHWVWESELGGEKGGKEGTEEGRWVWSLEKYRTNSTLLAVHPPSSPPASLESLPVELLTLILSSFSRAEKAAMCETSMRFLELASKSVYEKVKVDTALRSLSLLLRPRPSLPRTQRRPPPNMAVFPIANKSTPLGLRFFVASTQPSSTSLPTEERSFLLPSFPSPPTSSTSSIHGLASTRGVSNRGRRSKGALGCSSRTGRGWKRGWTVMRR